MLIGKYYYKLQANGRVSLPKEFRQETDQWIITRGLDGCLFVFKTETFTSELNQLAQHSFTKKAHRDFIRIMTNEAKTIDVDQLGRVQLPKYLIELAQLTDEIVIVGSFNRIEIWDREIYHQYIDQLESKAETIAETINHE